MIAEHEAKQPVTVYKYAKFQSVIFELLYKADPDSISLHVEQMYERGSNVIRASFRPFHSTSQSPLSTISFSLSLSFSFTCCNDLSYIQVTRVAVWH